MIGSHISITVCIESVICVSRTSYSQQIPTLNLTWEDENQASVGMQSQSSALGCLALFRIVAVDRKLKHLCFSNFTIIFFQVYIHHFKETSECTYELENLKIANKLRC